MDNQTIFAEGIYLNTVHEKAPDFIKANVSIHADKAIAWLQTMKATGMVNEKGYVNLVGKESKGGKRYFQLDTYKPKTEGTATTEDESVPF